LCGFSWILSRCGPSFPCALFLTRDHGLFLSHPPKLRSKTSVGPDQLLWFCTVYILLGCLRQRRNGGSHTFSIGLMSPDRQWAFFRYGARSSKRSHTADARALVPDCGGAAHARSSDANDRILLPTPDWRCHDCCQQLFPLSPKTFEQRFDAGSVHQDGKRHGDQCQLDQVPGKIF
jgi:hypothetical protein